MTRANPILSLVCAVIACSCSGGAASSPDPEPASAPADDAAAKREAALAQLEARQEAACQRAAPAVTACAVEDARANLSPEQLAELDLETLVPRAEREFFDQCVASDMSPRQVKVYETCLADTSCAALLPCLDAAKPKP